MSEQIRRAIDGPLNGLQVSERHVRSILAQAKEKPAQQVRRPMRIGVAIALAMLVLVTGVGITLSLGGPGGHEDVLLNQPGGREATMSAAAQITGEEAIGIAERCIHDQDDAQVDLRNETVYRISCTLQEPDLGSALPYYRVHFKALNETATEYTVHVDLEGNVLKMERQRGVGEWHTPAEIRAGYRRIWGEDMGQWTWKQLSTYGVQLDRASYDHMRWADILMSDVDYLDPATVSITGEDAQGRALAEMTALGYDGQVEAAVCLRAGTAKVWRVTIGQRVGSDGLEWVHFVEIDASTGTVTSHTRVDRANAELLAFIPQYELERNLQATVDSNCPNLRDEEVQRIAADHISQRYGETRNVNDPAIYTCMDGNGYVPHQMERYLVYQPVDPVDVTYWVCIDWYGGVMDSGAGRVTADVTDMDLIRMQATDSVPYAPKENEPGFYLVNNQPFARGYNDWELISIQEWAARCGDPEDPVVQLILNTTYATRSHDTPVEAVDRALNIKTRSIQSLTLICRDGVYIEKLTVESDKGNFLVEVNVDTGEIISVVQVRNCYYPWYAPFLLQADMEKAGVAPEPFTGVPENDGIAVTDEEAGVVRGMRISHLNDRFRSLYAPDFADWTQEQLRTWQQLAIVSESMGDDMGVYCLRRTYYPDIPAGAITREQAAGYGAAAIGLAPGYTMDGAVLIGTSGMPVWKVCLFGRLEGSQETADGYWYAEVNCMTGEVTATKQRLEGGANEIPYYGATPVEYWFRDIVLEETIVECEEDWHRTSNG